MAVASVKPLLRHLRRLVGQDSICPDGELLRRFADHGDEAAFAALVERYGLLVKGVCERVLGQAQDAEDAFQATFVVLARRAGTIRKQESLNSWLHGVAFRVARKARVAASIRHERERQALPLSAGVEPPDEPSWREVRQVLDDELQQMPARYRDPLLLCYLQGKTQDEAARELGWSAGTLRGRLDRGRDKLRKRLTKRGVSLSGALGAVLLAQSVGRAAVPAAWQQTTVQAALGAIGKATSEVSPAVHFLAESSSVAARSRMALIVGLVLVSLTAAAGLTAHLLTATNSPAEVAPDRPAPARTDLYGDPLPEGALARLGTIRFRPETGGTLLFLPDGKTLAHGSYGSISLIERDSGKHRTLDMGEKGMNRLTFSPDGRLVASYPSEKTGPQRDQVTVQIWDVTTGKPVRTISFHEPRNIAHSLSLSPGGEKLALGGISPLIRMIDATTGKELWKLDGEFGGNHRRVTFSRDGKMLAGVGPKDSALCLWDADNGRLLREVCPCTQVGGVNFSADSKILAACTRARKDGPLRVRLWDTANGKELAELADQPSIPFSVTLSPDGRTLAAAFGSTQQQVFWGPMDIVLWDVATGKKRHQFPGGECMAFSPDSKTLASGIPVCFRDVATGKELASNFIGHECTLWSVRYAPDGKTVLSEDRHQILRQWDPASSKQVDQRGSRLTLGNQWTHSPDGKWIAWLQRDSDTTLHLSEMATGKEVRVFEVDRKKFTSMAFAFSPDSKTLAIASGTTPPSIALWDVETGKMTAQVDKTPGNGYVRILYSPDGKYLALAGRDRTVRLWDVARKEEWRVFGEAVGAGQAAYDIWCLAFSADGKSLAANLRNEVVVWEVATGQERRRLPARATCLAFGPDGLTLLASGSNLSTLVWDVTGAKSAGKRDQPLSDQELEGLWADLAGADTVRAYRAVGLLAHRPEQGVAWLAQRLSPASFDEQRTARLLAGLESEEFAVREQATQDLEKLGDEAAPGLRRLLSGKPSLEARRRAEVLLDKHAKMVLTGARLREWRALEILEASGNPDARKLLAKLARGAEGLRLTLAARLSLERLQQPPPH